MLSPPWQAGPQLKLCSPDKGFQYTQPCQFSHSSFPSRLLLLLWQVFVCTAVYTHSGFICQTADTNIETKTIRLFSTILGILQQIPLESPTHMMLLIWCVFAHPRDTSAVI